MQEGKNARKMRWKTMRNTLHYDEKISQKKQWKNQRKQFQAGNKNIYEENV